MRQPALRAALRFALLAVPAMALTAGVAEAATKPVTAAKKALKAQPAPEPVNYQILPTKRLGDVAVYMPATPPAAIVLFLSGDGGWKLGVLGWAERFQKEGAMVLGMNAVTLQKVLKADSDTQACLSPSDEILGVVADARARYGVPATIPLVIGGYSSGASLAYVIMAQSAHGAYAGALAVSFCSDLITHKPFCPGATPEMVPTLGGQLGFIYPPITAGLPGFTAFLGSKDKICHTDKVVQFMSKIPGASIDVLPGQGHGFANDGQLLEDMVVTLRKLASAPAAPVTAATAPATAPVATP